MTKSLLVLALALSVAACSSSKEEKETTKKPGYAGSIGLSDEEKVVGEVDSSASCGQNPSLGMTLMTTPWVRNVETERMNRTQRLSFKETSFNGGDYQDGIMENQVLCSVNGATIMTRVTAQVRMTSDTVRILEERVDRKHVTLNGEEYTCEASLKPEFSFGYSLRSNCLILNSGEALSVFTAGQ